MKILIVCTQGQNRSRYLARYLKSEGHETDYGGVDLQGFNPVTQEKVDWADIIIAVHSAIKKEFLERFDPKEKKVLNLEVYDHPRKFPEEAQKLAETSNSEFQEKYVYSELRKQIEQYLHHFTK